VPKRSFRFFIVGVFSNKKTKASFLQDLTVVFNLLYNGFTIIVKDGFAFLRQNRLLQL
jgi:hypothetical protein